jgi:hypothetical protein
MSWNVSRNVENCICDFWTLAKVKRSNVNYVNDTSTIDGLVCDFVTDAFHEHRKLPTYKAKATENNEGFRRLTVIIELYLRHSKSTGESGNSRSHSSPSHNNPGGLTQDNPSTMEFRASYKHQNPINLLQCIPSSFQLLIGNDHFAFPAMKTSLHRRHFIEISEIVSPLDNWPERLSVSWGAQIFVLWKSRALFTSLDRRHNSWCRPWFTTVSV